MAQNIRCESTDDVSEAAARFVHLFARHQGHIFAFILTLVPHHVDAEDIFQRCSVTMWRRFSEFEFVDPQGSFLAWSCAVARNEVRNFLKLKKRHRFHLDTDLLELIAAESQSNLKVAFGTMDALQDCMASLPKDSRDLLVAAYSSQTSLKEMACSTGQVLQTLYNKLSRIRRMLLQCIERKISAEYLDGI